MNEKYTGRDARDEDLASNTKIADLLGGKFQSAAQFFKDIALTTSKEERRDHMLSKHKSHFGSLRDMFGWDSSTAREMKKRSCEDYPSPLTDTGEAIPVYHLALLGIGKVGGGCVAILRTNMEPGVLRSHALMLPGGQSAALLARWRQSHPTLCEVADRKVRECLRDPMPQPDVTAALREPREELIVVALGLEAHDASVCVINLGDNQDPDLLVAFLVSLFHRCPLGWMLEANDEGRATNTLHPLAASMISAQVDPGVIWTATSRDGCVHILESERGIRQVLPRPGIPLARFVSDPLWKLLGELSPHAGDDISLWGSTRENAAAIGIMFPRLPSVFVFALLQSGLSPALRRIVCLAPTSAPVDTARLIHGLLESCELATRNPAFQAVALNGFFCLERILRHEGQVFGMEPYIQALSSGEEETPEIFCVAPFVAAFQEGRIPDDHTIAALRRGYLDRGSEDEPEVIPGIRIAKRLLSWILVMLVRRMLGSREPGNEKHPDNDSWERDSRVTRRQKRMQQRAKAAATKISENQIAEMLPVAIRDALVFRFTKKSQNLKKQDGDHFAKLVSLLADALMVLVKRSEHGLVLEQRMWEVISRGCALTVSLPMGGLFRYPAADLYEPPSWLRHCAADPDDLIEIDLSPLCGRVRLSAMIRRQVESIRDICDCAAGVGVDMPGLRESCRINWDDDWSVLSNLAADRILRELRPSADAGRQKLTDWWLEVFGLNVDAAPKEARRLMGMLFDQDPEAAVLAMLEVAAADRTAVGARRSWRGPVVNISKSEVLRSYERASRTTESDRESRRVHGEASSNKSPTTKEDTEKDSTGSVKADTIVLEELISRLIRACARCEVLDLIDPKTDEARDHLAEMQRLLLKGRARLGRGEFLAIVAEAVRDIGPTRRRKAKNFLHRIGVLE